MVISSQSKADVPDRAAILAELEATRVKFHQLANSVSNAEWHQKSPTSDWTLGEILVHLTWSLEYLPREVSRGLRGKGMFNMPKFVADPMSFLYIRWLARKATRESILRRYDAAMAAVVALVDNIVDEDWAKGAKFYGEGFYTIEDLFHTPADHLKEHSAGIVNTD